MSDPAAPSPAYDSDGDELVATTPLLLAQPPPGKELYLLDYPSRAAAAPALGAERAVEQVRVRAAHRRVEMCVSIFPRTPDGGDSAASFDFERAPGSERYGEEGDRQKFVSAVASEPTANFVAASYVEPEGVGDGHGAVVLVPLQKVARMRPDFSYLDRVDKERMEEKAVIKAEREKEKGTLEAGEGAGGEDEGNEVRVEMQFKKRETERAVERRLKSYTYMQQIEEKDPWVALDFVDQTNPQIADCRREVFRTGTVEDGVVRAGDVGNAEVAGVKKEDAFISGSALDAGQNGSAASGMDAGGAVDSGKSYMDMFYEHAPGANPLAASLQRLGETGVPMDSVRALRCEVPEVAVQKLLFSARLVRLSMVRECAADSVPTHELLAHVRKNAFLLRGCWVVNVPRKRSRRHVGSRIPARLVASRALILDMFRRGRIVTRADISADAFASVVPPDEEAITDVLTEVAQFEPGVGWVFAMKSSSSGGDVVNSDVFQEEEAAWDERLDEARKVMAGSASGMRAGGGGGGSGAGGRKNSRAAGRVGSRGR